MTFSFFITPQRFCMAIAVPLAALLLPIPAKAMTVQPIVLDLSTSGGKASSQISVINDAAKPLPVEIVVLRAELDEKGDMTTKPASEDFLVVPQQVLIPPGATQSFRIQWVGDPQIKTSQSYVVSVNQVPVKMPEGKTGVQVVFNFATIVNIAPSVGKAEITLLKAGIGKDEKGKARPELTVKNPGNIHAKLTDATIKLSGGAWSQTLVPDQLRQLVGIGLIQPGKTRRFLIPVDMPDGVSQVTASIDYKPGK
jgi:fimbrial chaperone protein